MAKTIHITNNEQDIPFSKESSTLELLLKNDIKIDHSCGGMGSCGTCRVFVKSSLNDLPKRNEIEQERADDLCFEDDERLTCQLRPYSGLIIELQEFIEE